MNREYMSKEEILKECKDANFDFIDNSDSKLYKHIYPRSSSPEVQEMYDLIYEIVEKEGIPYAFCGEDIWITKEDYEKLKKRVIE